MRQLLSIFVVSLACMKTRIRARCSAALYSGEIDRAYCRAQNARTGHTKPRGTATRFLITAKLVQGQLSTRIVHIFNSKGRRCSSLMKELGPKKTWYRHWCEQWLAGLL